VSGKPARTIWPDAMANARADRRAAARAHERTGSPPAWSQSVCGRVATRNIPQIDNEAFAGTQHIVCYAGRFQRRKRAAAFLRHLLGSRPLGAGPVSVWE
jgi:hypothetical protein